MTHPFTATVAISGSERRPLAAAQRVGAVPPWQQIRVTVLVRRRAGGDDALQAHLSQAMQDKAPALDPAHFAQRFGADPTEFDRVVAFATAHGLNVVERRTAQRPLVLEGTAAACGAAFDVALESFALDSVGGVPNHGRDRARQYRGRSGEVHVPEALADIVEGVFGLDDRPQARPHFRVFAPAADRTTPGTAIVSPRSVSRSYTPPQLADTYDFPRAGRGRGQCIAIIELGGGYRAAELRDYFLGLGVTPPKVRSKSIDGGHNQPVGDSDSADGEVLLDIEVAGAIAPEAEIVVYFAPNTDAGFLAAVSGAIHDTENRPSVISISWGGPESSWTAQAMKAMDAAFQDAAALGVTICCAAGDDGSSDQRAPARDDGELHADFPASSPFVLACGGTRLEADDHADIPAVVPTAAWQETVWNRGRAGGATGGGVSAVFARPAWQDAAAVPVATRPGHPTGRGVPDVAANADPATGYEILVDGRRMVIGGTSAVAPLYAALVALCNEQLGRRLGYLNPMLYRLPSDAQAFRDIRSGDNDISGRHGPYAAGVGWDACTGLGSVRGGNLLAALKKD